VNSERLGRLLELRVGKICATLDGKAKEYASNTDRLHNFKTSATEFGGTSAQNLWGFLKKHLVSIKDMVDGHRKPTAAAVDEKIGDAICYLILLEAIFKEELDG
jgi:hypothetical protein